MIGKSSQIFLDRTPDDGLRLLQFWQGHRLPHHDPLWDFKHIMHEFSGKALSLVSASGNFVHIE